MRARNPRVHRSLTYNFAVHPVVSLDFYGFLLVQQVDSSTRGCEEQQGSNGHNEDGLFKKQRQVEAAPTVTGMRTERVVYDGTRGRGHGDR